MCSSAVSIPGSVLKGLGEPSEAGIHTLHQADDLTILNVVWAPLMVLLPHNHNMWASIGIYTGRACSMPGQLRACSSEALSATARAACPLTRSFHASS
jgi:predicted metal-dependent enzyme (double-stranded beta helix superfamily)